MTAIPQGWSRRKLQEVVHSLRRSCCIGPSNVTRLGCGLPIQAPKSQCPLIAGIIETDSLWVIYEYG